jgi:hypothetical protein
MRDCVLKEIMRKTCNGMMRYNIKNRTEGILLTLGPKKVTEREEIGSKAS